MILNNVSLVTHWPSRPVVEGALLAIEGKSIVDFDRVGKLIDRYEHPVTLDLGGRIVVPGGVDAFREPARALDPGRREGLWAEKLDPDSLYVGAVVSILDAVRAGATSVFLFHRTALGARASMAALRRALLDTGVRGQASVASTGAALEADDLDELRPLLRESSETFRGSLGLQLTPDTKDASISRRVELAGELGGWLHVRASSERRELDRSLERFGKTPVGRLGELQALALPGALVYAPWRTPDDEAALCESGARLVHCPESEMLAGVSKLRLAALRAQEVRLAVGSDGIGTGVFAATRLMVLREVSRGIDLESAIQLSHWAAFLQGSDLATAHFGPPVGQIRPGARADLVVLDAVPRLGLDEEQAPEELFHALGPARVHTTIVNGKILYQNGRFADLDEARYRARAREIAMRLREHN